MNALEQKAKELWEAEKGDLVRIKWDDLNSVGKGVWTEKAIQKNPFLTNEQWALIERLLITHRSYVHFWAIEFEADASASLKKVNELLDTVHDALI